MSQALPPRSRKPGGGSRAESATAVSPDTSFVMPVTSIRALDADGIRVFYREAGPPGPPSSEGIRTQYLYGVPNPAAVALAIWGKHHPFFIPAGAEAFRNDIRDARVQYLDTGHSATETHVVEIAAAMREFLDAKGASPARRE